MNRISDTYHRVTIDFGKDGYDPDLSLTCSAPTETWCHAEWSCTCEEFSFTGPNVDGMPAHTVYDPDTDDEVEHVGTYGKECGLVDWFAESDEVMRGAVTVPVVPEWDGSGYEFVLGGEAK